MSELVPIHDQDDVLVRVDTGELISLRDASQVAEYLRDLRQHIGQLHRIRALLEDLLVEESERQGAKTLHLGGVTATVSGGTETVWDVEELRNLLRVGLPPERWTDLVTTKVEEVVNARVAKQIASANPDYAKIIDGAKRTASKRYRVSTT